MDSRSRRSKKYRETHEDLRAQIERERWSTTPLGKYARDSRVEARA